MNFWRIFLVFFGEFPGGKAEGFCEKSSGTISQKIPKETHLEKVPTTFPSGILNFIPEEEHRETSGEMLELCG